MKVVTFETGDGRSRYYLADDNDVPVEPVLNYLRFISIPLWNRKSLPIQKFLFTSFAVVKNDIKFVQNDINYENNAFLKAIFHN